MRVLRVPWSNSHKQIYIRKGYNITLGKCHRNIFCCVIHLKRFSLYISNTCCAMERVSLSRGTHSACVCGSSASLIRNGRGRRTARDSLSGQRMP